jgi:outer membrane protein
MRTCFRALGLALFLPTVAASSALAQGPQKFAYINSQVVLQQAPGRTELEAQLKKEMDPYTKRMQVMEDSVATMLAAYQKDAPTLAPAVKTQREEAIQKKQRSFAEEAEQLQQKAAESRDRISRPLMEMFNRVLNEVRAEDGYAFIFDVGDPEAQLIVAADKNLDITEKVIARMRTTAAARPAGARPGTTPPKPTGPVAAPTGVKPPPPR